MTVREFITELSKLDQDKNIWLMYDPPHACDEPRVHHLVGYDKDYAHMFDEVKEGDYAIICEL